MTGDDADNDRNDAEETGDEIPVDTGGDELDEGATEEEKPFSRGRKRIGEEADRAVEGFDQGIVDLLSWVLDTETRARIYVYLRQNPGSTSEEIAEGTGLYPSTVRESLAELHEEENVSREKRESSGAGNNPYEYTAIAPSELVGGIVDQVQQELNTVFNLDSHLNDEVSETEPVSIEVEDISDDVETGGEDASDVADVSDTGDDDTEPDATESDEE
ncbi:winged helix-turn-helix transcriptional regulator [Haladaptatus sp. DYF46]|uniref:winged helix-turn-helix transcriptional regulator n=1 Tax=Haladaptatus sp. DYF46 TaxID=2886041 RepID=UPI001E29282C|nr:winged helix-turn-helix transcriptional regulator [Haladaptatus sp. DYF46]